MAYERKYDCIFCQFRADKQKLLRHLEKNHKSEFPEGFTSLQVLFHIVNKHPLSYKRPCRVCKAPTNWDENKGRYNILCESKQCHEVWAEKMKKDMGDKMGSNRPTSSPEGLQKMLAARKISGKYKFKDGKEFTYVGSYELETLKFMDQVMDIKSEDIAAPGPVLEYTLDGQKHFYITDIFYIPYNLIIEVKDGGTNPNTNPQMYDTRRKKIAKEKYVIEETNYNYLRLTNKDFSQLLAVFADLKMSLVEGGSRRVVHVNENTVKVNENMFAAIQGAIPPTSADGVYMVNYMKNNSFSGKSDIAVSDSPRFDTLYTIVDGVLVKTNESFLKDTKYNVYFVDNCKDRFVNYCINNENATITKGDLYSAIFGHRMILENQIEYEENAKEYTDFYYFNNTIKNRINEYIRKGE